MQKIYSTKDSSFYSRHLIHKTRHLLHKARQKELVPWRISPQQAYILLILHDLGHKTTLTELASYVERGTGTVSEQMTKMENDGLIKKTRETPKSTLLSFELTEKGFELFNHSNEMRVEKEIMSALSEEERQQLISILEKLISKAEKYQ